MIPAQTAAGLQTFDIGDSLLLQAMFYDLAGELANPDAVTARILDPSGTVSPLAPVEVTAGVWQAAYPVTLSGKHWFRYEGAGAVAAAKEEWFFVNEPEVPPLP